jgi:hypothetical protein
MLNDDQVLRCFGTREATQSLLGAPFTNPFGSLALVEEENDNDDPNVEVFVARALARLRHDEDEGGEGKTQEGVSLEGSHGHGA